MTRFKIGTRKPYDGLLSFQDKLSLKATVSDRIVSPKLRKEILKKLKEQGWL